MSGEVAITKEEFHYLLEVMEDAQSLQVEYSRVGPDTFYEVMDRECNRWALNLIHFARGGNFVVGDYT